MTNLWTAALKSHEMLSSVDMSSVTRPLIPLHHMSCVPSKVNPVVTVELNANGEVIQVVTEAKPHCIPSTLQSSSRTGSKACPHPLVDKVCYLVDERFQPALEDWAKATDNAYLKAVLKALPGLVRVFKKEDGSELNVSLLALSKKNLKLAGFSENDLKITVGGLETTSDTFVSWEMDGVNLSDALQQVWIDYYSEKIKSTNPVGLCYISGETVPLLMDGEFPKISTSQAKMVSCDDTSGLTYRGRFSHAMQAWGTGAVPALKANAAISFLLNNYALSSQSTRTVVWSDSQVLTSELSRAHEVFNPNKKIGRAFTSRDIKVRGSFENLHRFYMKGLRMLQGYRTLLSNPNESVYILSSTQTENGTVSNTLFEQLSMSQYQENLQAWQEDAGWFYLNPRNQKEAYVGAPTMHRLMAFFAPDSHSTRYQINPKSSLLDKVQTSAVNIILLGQAIPPYWVKEAAARASRVFFTPRGDAHRRDRINETFFISCALTRAYFNRHPNPSLRKELPMGLDTTFTDPSYLLGRYCALASYIENKALFKAKISRPTFVEQQFVWCSSHTPLQVLGPVARRLTPYYQKFKYLRGLWFKLSQEITDSISPADKSATTDSSIFMLGFNAQMKALWDDDAKRKAEREALNTTSVDEDE